MRLWLVRHGATEWSETGRLCGWTDVPLSPAGRGQAELLQPRLVGLPFDGVWTSDLSRASEFARLVIGDASPEMRLRELDFGDLEGKTWHDCDSSTRGALLWFDGFASPGGESVAELQDRVGGFLSGLVDGNHLVFTHGGVIRLLSRMRGLDSSPSPGELVVLDLEAIFQPSVQNEG